jgi:hypothetical protein
LHGDETETQYYARIGQENPKDKIKKYIITLTDSDFESDYDSDSELESDLE